MLWRWIASISACKSALSLWAAASESRCRTACSWRPDVSTSRGGPLALVLRGTGARCDSRIMCALAPPNPNELIATNPPSHGVFRSTTYDIQNGLWLYIKTYKKTLERNFVCTFQKITFILPSLSAGISRLGDL